MGVILGALLAAIAAYDLLYCGLGPGDNWRHPWQPIINGLGFSASVTSSQVTA